MAVVGTSAGTGWTTACKGMFIPVLAVVRSHQSKDSPLTVGMESVGRRTERNLMSNTATCANCHTIIQHNSKHGWVHRRNDSIGCGLIKDGQWKHAEPMSKTPIPVRHFGDPFYRPACGQERGPRVSIHPDWKETTCQRCMGTLKFKQAKGMTVKEPDANPQKCVHCDQPIHFNNWEGKWLHTEAPEMLDGEWCRPAGANMKATPPPLSAPKIEVTAPPPPVSVGPENAAVKVLQGHARLLENQLKGDRQRVDYYQTLLEQTEESLMRTKKAEATTRSELDEVNHALSLLGVV